MSGFLVATGTWAQRLTDESFASRITSLLSRRGSNAATRFIDSAAILTVSHEWENDIAPSPNLVVNPPLCAAADATLFYRKALMDRLGKGGSAVGAGSAAELIALAYQKFGTECLQFLEGDFAFAVWDMRTRAVFAARDPFGARSLFHATRGDSFAVASTPDPLRLLLDNPSIDQKDLVRAITGYHGDGTGTPWQGISELPAGWSISASTSAAPRAARYWYPGSISEWEKATSADAALILRDLITEATRERIQPAGAAVGMSGGRDSTAMVGTIEHRRKNGGAGSIPSLSVLSYRYPQGDPGNEDVYVNRIASSFEIPINWVAIDNVPVFSNAIERGDRRSRPDPQPFEGLNRVLASAARQLGKRVLLNGNGGDNLLDVSDSWLADLVRRGRWGRFRKELRVRNNPGKSWILRTCIRPAIPFGLLDAAEPFIKRRILSRPWESHAPEWMTHNLLEREAIIDEDRAHFQREITHKADGVERRLRLWALLFAGFQRNCAALFDMSIDEGVELRMPFYDRRIADFAWSRPATDLNNGREHKVLLRTAMEQILPPEVVAPRPQRTGTSDSYFHRMAKKEMAGFAEPLMVDPILAQMGIVDPLLLRRHIQNWETDAPRQQIFTVNACSTESWLRAHI